MLAYPPADLDVDIYLELPHGFHIDGYTKKDLFSSSTRPYTASNKLDTTGSKS
jgi:hypothetical protein